ncbi:hypothetical protein QJS25_gp29 [Serratia phage vB_SmaS_Bonzee]|nr:hypothetical protein QJS25_gp29 [Serratia phage vB_SmaS_Bonzee]UKL15167.1 hypothetical protein BONZEE_29 [Serratia phage vB_SmaS_Bonzee]
MKSEKIFSYFLMAVVFVFSLPSMWHFVKVMMGIFR